MFATTISVPWPNYDIEIWRDWLLKNVGLQGVRWQWWLEPGLPQTNVKIEFVKPSHAVLFCLRWLGD